MPEQCCNHTKHFFILLNTSSPLHNITFNRLPTAFMGDMQLPGEVEASCQHPWELGGSCANSVVGGKQEEAELLLWEVGPPSPLWACTGLQKLQVGPPVPKRPSETGTGCLPCCHGDKASIHQAAHTASSQQPPPNPSRTGGLWRG